MLKFREWQKTNQAIGFILSLVFIAFIIYLLLSPWVFKKCGDGFYLGFFPFISVVLLFLLSSILTFDSRRKETPDDLKTLTFKSFVGVLLLGGGCWFYFVVMRQIGFLIITPICLFITMYILGLRPWLRCITWAVVLMAVVYTIFSLLGLELPKGILSGILPF
ncbi:tripartite tricarboxylate transporter TctB family protein [Chloroflexota bacterium]